MRREASVAFVGANPAARRRSRTSALGCGTPQHEEARAGPGALAEGDDRVARERPQVLLGTEHRAPEGMVAEGRPVDEVLRDRRRLVLVALDLLDHDAALAVELVGVQVRAPGEVRQEV